MADHMLTAVFSFGQQIRIDLSPIRVDGKSYGPDGLAILLKSLASITAWRPQASWRLRVVMQGC